MTTKPAQQSLYEQLGGAPAVELQPEEIVVSASVEARFRAS